MALVEPEALRAHLANIGATGAPVAAADEAAATASAYVAAYASRLRPGEPVPPVVRRVSLALATRLVSNPKSIRSVSTQGQSADLAPTGLTYLESLLLAPYRRRTQ